MKKTIYIITIAAIFTSGMLSAQKAKVSNAIKQYDKLSYIDSRSTLLELANKENPKPEVIERLANTYYFNNDMKDAQEWYKKLVLLESEINPENYFRYAQALKGIGNYDEADKVFKTFANLKPEDSRAIKFLSNKNYLKTIKDVSRDFTLENLAINTPFSDFGASIYNNKLIFASSRDQSEKIYSWNDQPFLDLFEMYEDGNTQEIMGDVNTKYHESSTSYTKDGLTMYFTRNNYYNSKFKKNSNNTHALKIYKATLVDGKWTDIVSMPFNNNEYSVAHPALSVDEKKLFFASDMPGTKGLSDIFVVEINEDGTYGIPKNLGPKINTEGRENFPFISEKGILYYSSDGHSGLGGLDVFMIETDNIATARLKNLGKPINSNRDDFAFIINESTQKGYISSNRAGGKGDDDIYSFTIPECMFDIQGKVVNKRTKEILPNATVTLKDEENNILQTVNSDVNGLFQFNLDCKLKSYKIDAEKETFEGDTTNFKVETKSSTNLNLELSLQPSAAKLGTDLALLLGLKPIYFDYDKSFIRPDAELELAKIINYMQKYPSVEVDVRSHTDSRGRDAYNLSLSKRRNSSTKQYIINKGKIASHRISGEGYGETRLKNRCSNGVKCSKLEHQENRRSEFIVTKN